MVHTEKCILMFMKMVLWWFSSRLKLFFKRLETFKLFFCFFLRFLLFPFSLFGFIANLHLINKKSKVNKFKSKVVSYSRFNMKKSFIPCVTRTSYVIFPQDGNGYIDEQELDALLKDLCDKNKMVMSLSTDPFRLPSFFQNRETIGAWDEMLGRLRRQQNTLHPPTVWLCVCFGQDVDSTGLDGYKRSIMALSDGGKLYRTELEIVLCRDSTLWPPCLRSCCPLPTMPPPSYLLV